MTTIGRRRLSQFLLAVSLLTVRASAAPAKATVVGEVIETYCWVVHEVGGEGHAQCGIECAKHGLPVALYETTTRSAYILLPARDKAALPAALVNAMGKRVRIDGEVITRGGIRFLVVHSWQSGAAKR